MSEWNIIHENFNAEQRVHSAGCTHEYITLEIQQYKRKTHGFRTFPR